MNTKTVIKNAGSKRPATFAVTVVAAVNAVFNFVFDELAKLDGLSGVAGSLADLYDSDQIQAVVLYVSVAAATWLVARKSFSRDRYERDIIEALETDPAADVGEGEGR